jgi:hypothetical protein
MLVARVNLCPDTKRKQNQEQMQVLRLTTPELKNVRGPFRSGWPPWGECLFRMDMKCKCTSADLSVRARAFIQIDCGFSARLKSFPFKAQEATAGPSTPHSLRSGSLRMTGESGGSQLSLVVMPWPGRRRLGALLASRGRWLGNRLTGFCRRLLRRGLLSGRRIPCLRCRPSIATCARLCGVRRRT